MFVCFEFEIRKNRDAFSVRVHSFPNEIYHAKPEISTETIKNFRKKTHSVPLVVICFAKAHTGVAT